MLKTVNVIKLISICFILLLCIIIGTYYVIIPEKFYLSTNNHLEIENLKEIKASPYYNNDTSLAMSGDETSNYILSLFGILPIKTVEVKRTERPVLVPCGTPFGIKVLSDGAMVTGFGNVESSKNPFSPAKEAGIMEGDIIQKVNGVNVLSNQDVASAIQLNPEKTTVTLKRNGKSMTITLKPIIDIDKTYKVGMYVRDSIAGIGTMTFYDPETNVFGGLGHAVCDINTGIIVPILEGEAVAVSINRIVKGYAGNPGELSGIFMSHTSIGHILKNTEEGVFGTLSHTPNLKPMEMAFKQETQVGPATIYTTVDGMNAKEYDIIIEKIDFTSSTNVKNMVIRVTDPELLRLTGGIAQGMSGSPIIQNGRLVGAVTHVFINDTTRGYGIFCENMYDISKTTNVEILENAA